MINVSLVISKEPKQIIRTNTNFSCSQAPVTLVVLPFCTNMMITAVDAVFISHKTAASFFKAGAKAHEKLPQKSGDLKFGKGGKKIIENKVEFQTISVTKVSCLYFLWISVNLNFETRNAKNNFHIINSFQVSKSSKRGEQFVVEEMFCLYFRVTVNWQNHSFHVNRNLIL